jgi:hypothetical protein
MVTVPLEIQQRMVRRVVRGARRRRIQAAVHLLPGLAAARGQARAEGTPAAASRCATLPPAWCWSYERAGAERRAA